MLFMSASGRFSTPSTKRGNCGLWVDTLTSMEGAIKRNINRSTAVG